MKIYYQEHCTQKKTVAAMSPGSCPGRGAVTLTPDPNGAKVFNITRRAQRGSNKVPKFKRIGVRPLSQGAVKMTANCAGGRDTGPEDCPSPFWMGLGIQGVFYVGLLTTIGSCYCGGPTTFVLAPPRATVARTPAETNTRVSPVRPHDLMRSPNRQCLFLVGSI